MPSEALKLLGKSVNQNILVKLKDGYEYTGILARWDEYMNLVIMEAREVKEEGSQTTINYGCIFIRGNNILYIIPNYKEA